MARYELRVRPSVAKDLRGIPKTDVERILSRIEALRDEPRPQGSEKLSAQERYRIRQGNYRIIYGIEEAKVVVEIVKVGHRRDGIPGVMKGRRAWNISRESGSDGDGVKELNRSWFREWAWPIFRCAFPMHPPVRVMKPLPI